jgi:hypothetical protein
MPLERRDKDRKDSLETLAADTVRRLPDDLQRLSDRFGMAPRFVSALRGYRQLRVRRACAPWKFLLRHLALLVSCSSPAVTRSHEASALTL